MAQSTSQMGQGSQVKDKVQGLAGQAGDQVQQAAGQAQEQVKSQVDQRSTEMGERIGSTAHDLRTVAKELRNSDKEQPAALADRAAEKAEQFADYLKQSDGQTILSDVESFGRRQPWAIVAGGVALGFLASRFLKSSSTNRYRSGGSSIGSGNGRGLEYDGPQDVDIPSSTYIPPGRGSASGGSAPGAVTGTTASGTVDTPSSGSRNDADTGSGTRPFGS